MEETFEFAKVNKTMGTYHFRIEGYSGLPRQIGYKVESPDFSMCGHQWILRIFPGGSLVKKKKRK
jgi:hypothetical protein